MRQILADFRAVFGLQAGDRVGRFTILHISEFASTAGVTTRYAHCLCDCGETRVIAVDALRSGARTSCGCEQGEPCWTQAIAEASDAA